MSALKAHLGTILSPFIMPMKVLYTLAIINLSHSIRLKIEKKFNHHLTKAVQQFSWLQELVLTTFQSPKAFDSRPMLEELISVLDSVIMFT